MNRISRIYLDYAATTPVDPLVLAAMKPYFSGKFGNPGSVHSFGQEAIAAVDVSREKIVATIGAEFREVIFTGSATETNNLALRGLVKGLPHMNIHESQGMAAGNFQPRIVVSAIEHESILETARELENEGVEVVYVPVDKNGTIDLRALKASLNDRTVLVSVMYANNEIGTIQPIHEIRGMIDDFKKEHYNGVTPHHFPLLHIDAVQAFQFLECDVKKLGIDMMTLSAHKIYGPKGIGCLYVRRSPGVNRRACAAIITGGGQEFGMRSGTENVPSIVGFSKAAEHAVMMRDRESKRTAQLRNYFWNKVVKIHPKAEINGIAPRASVRVPRSVPRTLPNILNIYFPGHEAQDILTRLDLQGVAASSGSACRSRALDESYVITALGHIASRQRAKASVRFSFGRPTTKKEINAALAALKKSL